jgi:hypothetical protein
MNMLSKKVRNFILYLISNALDEIVREIEMYKNEVAAN